MTSWFPCKIGPYGPFLQIFVNFGKLAQIPSWTYGKQEFPNRITELKIIQYFCRNMSQTKEVPESKFIHLKNKCTWIRIIKYEILNIVKSDHKKLK